MIETPDLISFLRNGQSLCDIKLAQMKQDVVSKFGVLLTHYGDNKVGYFELPKGIRYGYTGGMIDEFAILNKRDDAIFQLYVPEILQTFKRKTAYVITTKSIDIESKLKKYVIAFADNSEEWNVHFYIPGNDVPWHGKAKKLYIHFNMEPNCVCGCKEELYGQEIEAGIVNR